MSVEIVYLTNYNALLSKYGEHGAVQIWNAIIDKANAGPAWALANLAVKGDWNFTPVSNPTDPKQNKTAIDGIYKEWTPNYMVIVGASDIVPFQNLTNPKKSNGDPDAYAWGDIPYACDAPYSKDPANFRAPTRVVGRIPDVVGGTDANYLLNLLKIAGSAKTRPASDYQKYLGVSADVWKGSTSESLTNIFGSSSQLQLAPPNGPEWSTALLGTRAQFVNCHGGSTDPFWYGQKGSSYPKAQSAAYISGKISSGTVATAECCYGAQLYDPAKAGVHMGICNTFLESGGYGFFGSSTIAYGPADGNGAADLITQYFLKHVLAGASLGRATLQAQQEYIAAEAAATGAINPTALKTLAQFYLLGDPSIHPVEKPATATKAADALLMKGLPKTAFSTERARVGRRQELVRRGLALYDSVAYTSLSKKLKPSSNVNKALRQMAKNLKMKHEDVQSHIVRGGVVPKAAFGLKVPERVFHVMEGEVGRPQKTFTPTAVIEVEEQEGKIIAVRTFYRR